MKYNEQLTQKALQKDKGALEELKFNAGSGSAEAQYYLAMYYQTKSNDDVDQIENYQYWIQKAVANGYKETPNNIIFPQKDKEKNNKEQSVIQKETIEPYIDTSNKEFGTTFYRPNFTHTETDKKISNQKMYNTPPNYSAFQEKWWERLGKLVLYCVISSIVILFFRGC